MLWRCWLICSTRYWWARNTRCFICKALHFVLILKQCVEKYQKWEKGSEGTWQKTTHMMRTVFPFWKDWRQCENGPVCISEAFPRKGLNHLIYEIVDNSVDEHLAGYCDQIHVTLEKDGSCTVTGQWPGYSGGNA